MWTALRSGYVAEPRSQAERLARAVAQHNIRVRPPTLRKIRRCCRTFAFACLVQSCPLEARTAVQPDCRCEQGHARQPCSLHS